MVNESVQNRDQLEVRGEGDVGGRNAPLQYVTGLPVADAGLPRPESGEGAEDEEGYQVVTRARGRLKISSNTRTNENQPAVFRFSHIDEASRKRRAEGTLSDTNRDASTAEEIRSLKTLIIQLLDREDERSREAETRAAEINDLKREVQELKKLLQPGAGNRPTYAAALSAGTRVEGATATVQTHRSRPSSAMRKLRAEDDGCSITVNTSRVKGDKTDFARIKTAMQKAIEDDPALTGLQIRCLRELSGERINVVFANEEHARKAKENTDWLSVAMADARLKSEEWYPIKCDMVVKRAVLDEAVEGGRTLRKEICAEFAQDNRSEDVDFTAMKASWLSRMDPRKKTGSLVILLKNKLAADYFLSTGQALFGGGAYGAFCSRYEPSTTDKLCFNCNTYGHMQGSCKKPSKCGKCSGAHQTWNCQSQDGPKCAVCAGRHRSSDWQCVRHPSHKKYLAVQKRMAAAPSATEERTRDQDVDMEIQAGKRRQVQWSLLNDESLATFEVLAVVEPHLHEDFETGQAECGSHPRWRPLIPTTVHTGREARYAYRAMLWVNLRIQAIQVPVPSPDVIAATIETPQGSVLVIAAYDPDEGDDVPERDRKLHQKLACVRQAIDATRQKNGMDTNIILCSDFNRHDALWGGLGNIAQRRRDEGIPIVHLAHEYGLQSMLPAGTVTWEHHSGNQQSTVDVILANAELASQVMRCQIHDHDHGSDHRPIAIEFDRLAPARPTAHSRMFPEKADWAQIRGEMAKKLKALTVPVTTTKASLDDVAERFLYAIIEVVHNHVPRARPSPHAKRWWTADLSILRDSLSSARNRVTTLRRRGEDTAEALAKCRAIRNEYFGQIVKQKKLHWREFLQDPKNIWKANQFTRTASRGTSVPTLQEGTRVAEMDTDKANLLMETFFPIPPEPVPGKQTTQQTKTAATCKPPKLLPPITEEEVVQAIYRAHPRKAPGADEITFAMWRELLPCVGRWLLWIYQTSVDLGYVPKSWRTAKIVALKKPGKADYTKPKAYRPISLLPTISKGLESIMASRLAYLAERYSLLPPNHFGGRKHRSCEQALDVLVEKIFEAWRKNRLLSLVTFDVQGAFNGVHPRVLEGRLRERRVPEAMVRWIRSFCEERRASVVVGGFTSDLTPIAHAGIPQGSPLSPILYVFYNANLVEGKIGSDGGSMGFIDDFTAWRTGSTSTETTRKLQKEVVRAAENWSRESGATFEAEKTGLIHFHRHLSEPEDGPGLRFLGKRIKPQDAVKILGVVLDAKLRMTNHIDKVVQAATRKCLALRRLKGIRPKQMRQLYRAVIAPTTDYAASTWFAVDRWGTRDHVTRLNRIQRMGAQTIIGAFRTVSTAVLQDEAGLEPVEHRLALRVAKHTQKARALPKSHPAWTIMNSMQGRPGRHMSPLFMTWARYYRTIQRTKAEGLSAMTPYVLPPWYNIQGMFVVDEDAVACRLQHQLLKSASKPLLLYTDASVRNKVTGVSVVMLDRTRFKPMYDVVEQRTIGREKTCTVATAEICAITSALEVIRCKKRAGWIMTDSQEAIRLIDRRGRSNKSREAVCEALRAIQRVQERGVNVKILWIPGHKGIEGNEMAHRAAQEMTTAGRQPVSDMGKQVREHGAISKLLVKEVEAERADKLSIWGRYTYALDSALPGKHTLLLYGSLSREDAGILAQARTGHTHLNEYRARIKVMADAQCDCGGGVESVKHVILQCPMWTTERQRLREAAGDRWGDVSFLLGGKSRKRDSRTGALVDGDKWKPNMTVVQETIAFLKGTGRFAAEVQFRHPS